MWPRIQPGEIFILSGSQTLVDMITTCWGVKIQIPRPSSRSIQEVRGRPGNLLCNLVPALTLPVQEMENSIPSW